MQAVLARKTLTITDIVSQLSHHLIRCHTGIFLVATNDNRSCRVSLNAGRITHCSFGREHGDSALQKMTEIQAGSYSFLRNAPIPVKERAKVNNKQAFDHLVNALHQHSENSPKQADREKLPSGLTDEQMEALFGRFHFE